MARAYWLVNNCEPRTIQAITACALAAKFNGDKAVNNLTARDDVCRF